MPEVQVTDAQPVQIPEDFAAYEAWRNKQDSDEVDETPAAGEEPAETAPQDSEPEKPQEPKEPEIPAGVQKRIDKAVAKQRDAERRAEEAERRLAEIQGSRPAPEKNAEPATTPEGKPKPEAFRTYDEYVEALTDWRVEQREQAREQAEAQRKAQEAAQTAQTEWEKRVEAVKAKHSDFDEVLGEAQIPIPPALYEAIFTDAHGPEVAYHLATHADEAERIAALPPVAAVRELGKLSAKFDSAPEPEKPKVSKAPPPPKPVGAKAKSEVSIHDEHISFADYERLRKAQLRRR
jgi:hypothetical protein